MKYSRKQKETNDGNRNWKLHLWREYFVAYLPFFFVGFFFGRSLFQSYQHLPQVFAFWQSFETVIWTNCESKRSKVNTGHLECSEAGRYNTPPISYTRTRQSSRSYSLLEKKVAPKVCSSKVVFETSLEICFCWVGLFFRSGLLRSLNIGPNFWGGFNLT